MASAAQLRRDVEAALRERAPGVRLQLAPRLVSPGSGTGFETLDEVLRGGLPVAGTSEIVGTRSSGRATLAMAYLAERTREGHVCAWIDVSGELSSEAALADGVDLDRVLWVRCSGAPEPGEGEVSFSGQALALRAGDPGRRVVEIRALAKPDLKPLNPGWRVKAGTPSAPNRAVGGSHAAGLLKTKAKREVQVATDRLPSRRGERVSKPAGTDFEGKKVVHARSAEASRGGREGRLRSPEVKPWTRLEQAIKAVDLLVQGGGFGAVVLDLGSIAPKFARRIPLATWFRWRAALQRSRCALVVLSQMGCAGSSTELTVRVEAEVPPEGTVLTGVEYRLEVVRRRFEEATEEPSQPGRKQPRAETGRAGTWGSRATWVAS